MVFWRLCAFASLGAGLSVVTRRHCLEIATTTILLGSQPALASDEFDVLRAELDGTGTGGLQRLEKLLEDEAFTDVLQLTKEYNGFVRNNVIAKARKQVSEENKDLAKDIFNAVEEDLIAINKLSRPKGMENKQEALRYLAALKTDLAKFAALDPAL